MKDTRTTLPVVFLLGVGIGLVGDAGHVQAGVTEYLWDGVPTIWKSALWFPFFVGAAITLGAWLASLLHTAPAARDRRDALIGGAIILALYSLTTVTATAPAIAAGSLCWGIALAVWIWWDDGLSAAAFGVIAMVCGPAAEIMMVDLGASRYVPGHDSLFGVAPWLLPLYFAVGVILSGIVQALQRPAR